MIYIKKKFSKPEYLEKKKVYLTLGYKEKEVKENGDKVYVTYEVDETDKSYPAIRSLEKRLYRRGPSFLPVIILVAASFTLLSVFVILLARDKASFDLTSNALAFLLPAFTLLALAVVYTYLYFHINKKIIEESPRLVNNLEEIVKAIRK